MTQTVLNFQQDFLYFNLIMILMLAIPKFSSSKTILFSKSI